MISKNTLKAALARLVPQSVYLSINARAAARDIASKRRWAPEIDSLPKFVHAGDTVIDVGANHGLYAYHLSRLVGPSGTVHAFEPLPPNLQILRHTIKTHKLQNVILHAQGCGDENAQAGFCVPMEGSVPQLACARQGTDGQKYKCDIVRLDDVIHTKISLLKIDVEGAELFVLRGAARILRESRPAILFEADEHTVQFRYEQQRVFDFLKTFGYAFFGGAANGRAFERRQGFTTKGDYFAVAE